MTGESSLIASCDLRRVAIGELSHFADDDFPAFWAPFLASSRALVDEAPELRKAVPPNEGLREICRAALALGPTPAANAIRDFIERHFEPHLILQADQDERAFFTAYYRPEVSASRVRTADHQEALLARPADLVTLSPDDATPGLEGLTSAQRRADGSLRPYPTRAEIDAGALGAAARPVAFVRDAIEAFMIQVQGSARLILDDGSRLDLTYAGRNGRPYTSIGKLLIARGDIDLASMSLERLKAWVRAAGQNIGERGRELLQANESFVFFAAEPAKRDETGPIGAAGLPLTPYRSLAIDRTLWPYGTPFWIDAELPWRGDRAERFARLMVGQDTGSAIVGAARADLFFGDGAEAGRLAGFIRHHGRMFVLLPRTDRP